jgi:hypothetical protein
MTDTTQKQIVDDEQEFEAEVKSLANNSVIQEMFTKSHQQFQRKKGTSLSDVRKRFGLEKQRTVES